MSELVVNLDPGQTVNLGLGALHDTAGNVVGTDSITTGSSSWSTDVDTFLTESASADSDSRSYTANDAGPGTTNVSVSATTVDGATVWGAAQIVTSGPAVEVDVVVLSGPS
jgi:hypothetical protein